ncbi:MAG: dioxygenase, partial [Zetaproteobacteria bacterium]
MPKRALPVFFISHGAPTHAVADSAAARFWARIPEMLDAPVRCVLVVSAHWEARALTLAGRTASPRIQHDFYGFPETLYRLSWPLPDGRETGEWLKARLVEILEDVQEDPSRLLDHGVWVPLMRAWPKMPYPVFQLSLVAGWRGEDYLRLGAHLGALREEGVLLVGSGGIVHNLAELDRRHSLAEPAHWAQAFVQAVEVALASRDTEALLDPWALPHGRRAHPTREHYWPLLVALGAAEGPMVAWFRAWEMGTLAMHAFRDFRLSSKSMHADTPPWHDCCA